MLWSGTLLNRIWVLQQVYTPAASSSLLFTFFPKSGLPIFSDFLRGQAQKNVVHPAPAYYCSEVRICSTILPYRLRRSDSSCSVFTTKLVAHLLPNFMFQSTALCSDHECERPHIGGSVFRNSDMTTTPQYPSDTTTASRAQSNTSTDLLIDSKKCATYVRGDVFRNTRNSRTASANRLCQPPVLPSHNQGFQRACVLPFVRTRFLEAGTTDYTPSSFGSVLPPSALQGT
jgi:hypothetical protein